MFLTIIDHIAAKVDRSGKIERKDKEFIAEFCSYGLVGIVVQWARSGMREPPQEIVERLKHFINDSNYVAANRFLHGNSHKPPQGDETAVPK